MPENVIENQLSYEDFKKEWLKEILENDPSTVELGHRFARKILGDWLDFNAETEDTLIIQHVNSYQPYSTILTSSNSFIGSYVIPFTDVAINSINADIYYGDGSQWIKIKSAT